MKKENLAVADLTVENVMEQKERQINFERKEERKMNKKVVKKILAMGLSVSLLVSGVAAGNYASAAKKLNVSAKKITLYVGKKKTIKANMSVKFSVSNKKVVSLKKVKKKQCTVVAKKKGSCTIKVKANKQIKKIKVTVKKITPVKTQTPTKAPVVASTETPTAVPTEMSTPTVSPTAVVPTHPAETIAPSIAPVTTPEATVVPTETETPSSKPLETIIPSVIPIPEQKETEIPSATPEVTLKPSATPEAEATMEPSESPVVTATLQPTPAVIPTLVPTKEPVQLSENLSMEDKINYFGFRMLDELNEDSNVMISPYSIMMAMTMLDNAADGETKAEMERVLGIANLDKWNEEFSTYYKTYLNQTDKKYTLHTANSIWKNDTNFSFDSLVQTKYLDVMKDLYGMENLSMDFVTSNPKEQINSWVAEKTEDMIKELIKDPIDVDVQNVLVNALYFSGKWDMEFEKRLTTHNVDFYGKNGTTKVDMMHNSEGDFKYLENSTLAVAEFPFEDGDMVMDVVLAKEDASTIEEFGKLSDKEKTELFQQVSNSKEENLNVSLPKFKMTYGTKNIKAQLQQMGIISAFDKDKAQIPGLKGDNSNNMYVSDVLHQSVIEVEEGGVKAAAATGIVIKETSEVNPSEVTNFNVNKPFVYVIRDTKTNIIYFVGQIEELTEENQMN